LFFAPPEQTPSRTWKVRGPKAEHFLASSICAEIVQSRRYDDIQRILRWLIVQFLD
jgi:hypothetical protein